MVEVTLPSFKDKAIAINDQTSKTIYINPNTNEVLNTNGETNFITNFFNNIHVGRNIPKIGTILMGIASIFMIFLCLSGVILWMNNKRKDKSKEKFYFKWHKNLSLTLLPYILVFSLTGAMLGFMLSSSTPIVYSASETKETNLRKLVGPILFPRDVNVKPSPKEQMLEISKLLKIAQKQYPNLVIDKFKLFSWGERNAKIKFFGYLENNRYITGNINRMNIELKGSTGEVLSKKELENSNLGNKILSTFYFLHFIPDETLVLRIFYFIFGIIMAVSLSFGFLIYSENKAKKAKGDENYYSILNKLAMATMIGIIPASCLTMFLYWYLPFNMFERPTWLQGSFYALWAGTLCYAVLKDNVLKVINHLLFLSTILLFLTVVFHGVSTGFYPWVSFQVKLWDVFFVDTLLLVFALAFFIFFKKSKDIKFFYKYDGDRYENQ